MTDKSGSTPSDLTAFGQYRIIEEIGRGGMGVIYRAHDRSLDRIIALKILREDFRQQKDLVARFRREAQAAARLNHPNIVQIYAVGEEDSIPYIAMEYIDGVPLSKLLQVEGPFPWRRALEIAEQVAEALACAHGAQVIHRDIKPQNILINSADQAFVTDFGIAKILSVEEQLTVDGTSLGTPQFMAPERCRTGEVTTASDIYSLGVLLFQMLTGRLPFEASSSVELVRKILGEQPTRLRAYAPHIPESVERLVAYLIEKKPEDRPANAEKVSEAFGLIREDRPLDEEQLTVSSALDDFRRTGPPKLTQYYNEATTKLLLAQRPIRSFTLHWFGTPHPWKVAVVGILLLVLGTLLGRLITEAIREDPTVIRARELESDISLWFDHGMVAAYVDNAPGLWIARINIQDMTLDKAAWCYDHAYVQLEGDPTTPRMGQRTIVALHPDSLGAWISVPPAFDLRNTAYSNTIELLTGARHCPPGSLMAAQALVRYRMDFAETSGSRTSIFVSGPIASYTSPLALFSPALDQDNALQDLLKNEVVAIAISPDGRRFATAFNQEEGHMVAEILMRTDGLRDHRIISPPGPPVSTIAYAASGFAVAIERRPNHHMRQLWLGSSLEESEVLLTEGPFEMAPGAIHPQGHSAVLAVEQLNQENEIRIYRLDQPDSPQVLGNGLSPSWHPSGDSIIALALDERQRLQVVAFETNEPFRRRQLTHYEHGLKPYCVTSGNGEWALVGLENVDSSYPHIGLVSLTRATW